MAISRNLSLPKLGNTSASSLIKSASTLQNELNTYQDTLQKITFENNPNDANLNAYMDYLQKRVNVLNATGTVTNATKALTMTQEMRTAISSNTSFNIQNESIQVLAGTGTDQQKLDYISSAYQRAVSVGDIKLAQSLESQAYNLQQSIAYHAQAQATANQVAQTAYETAIKQGYTNAVDALTGSWKQILETYKQGGAADVQASLVNFTKQQEPLFKALGVQLPQGSQLTMSGLAQAVMDAQHAYYSNAAVAINDGTPTGQADAQAFQQKADALYQVTPQGIVPGTATIGTPAGSMTYNQIQQWASESTNMWRASTNAEGITTLSQNAITGYKMVKGQILPVPQTNGSTVTGFDQMSTNVQKQTEQKLANLGFSPSGTNWAKNGYLTGVITNKLAKQMGFKNGVSNDGGLHIGDQVTLVPTSKGFQFIGSNGQVYGLSVDNRGLGALYTQNTNGQWNMLQGQYGFNPAVSQMIGAAEVAASNALKQQQIQAARFVSPTNTVGQVAAMTTARNIASAPPINTYHGPTMNQRAGGGFNFTNAQGQPISAATYAQQTGVAFRTLLSQMAAKGDTGAQSVLGFVGNDFRYDPTKVNSSNYGLYSAMTWGARGAEGAPSGTNPFQIQTNPFSMGSIK